MIGIKEKPIFIEFSLEKEPSQRTTEEVIEIVKLLSQIKFLKSFSHNPDFIEVCRHVRLEKYSEGKIIFKQGDPGDKFYIILSGTVGIYVNKYSKSKEIQYMKEITTLEEGGSFGELALIFNATRSASVIAHSATQLIVLDREIFQKYISSQHTENLNKIHGFLKTLRIFEDMSDEDLMKMSSKALFYKYNSNTLLIRQGEEPNSIFFIRNGMVKLVRKVKFKINHNFELNEEEMDDPTNGEVKRGFFKDIDLSVGDLSKGDYFGDHEVLHKQKMSFSVVTTMQTEIILVSTYDLKTIASNNTLEKMIKYMKFVPRDKDLRRAYLEGRIFKNFKTQYLKNCVQEKSYKKMFAKGEVGRNEIKPLKEPQIRLLEEEKFRKAHAEEHTEQAEEVEVVSPSQKGMKFKRGLSIITRSVSQQIEFFRKQKSVYNIRGSIRLEESEKDKIKSLKLIPKRILSLNETDTKMSSKFKKTKTFIDLGNLNLSPVKLKASVFKQSSDDEKGDPKKSVSKLQKLLSIEPNMQKNQKFIFPKINLKSTSILEGILNNII